MSVILTKNSAKCGRKYIKSILNTAILYCVSTAISHCPTLQCSAALADTSFYTNIFCTITENKNIFCDFPRFWCNFWMLYNDLNGINSIYIILLNSASSVIRVRIWRNIFLSAKLTCKPWCFVSVSLWLMLKFRLDDPNDPDDIDDLDDLYDLCLGCLRWPGWQRWSRSKMIEMTRDSQKTLMT